jgi:predicted RNA-binding protein (virulence factor B family)
MNDHRNPHDRHTANRDGHRESREERAERPRTTPPPEREMRDAPQPGQVAWLRVVEVNNTGAFLDWGREKDLLLPYGEQNGRVVVGQHCLVCVLEDDDDRPFASMKLDEIIRDEAEGYETGDAVELIVSGPTDLGMKVVVDHRYWGLLYRDEIFRPLRAGQQLRGHVKKMREDGRLDVSINPPAHVAAAALTDRILAAIDAHDGKLSITDKSSPQEIQRTFGVSKGVFKQAVGALYKERLIVIDTSCLRRAAQPGRG